VSKLRQSSILLEVMILTHSPSCATCGEILRYTGRTVDMVLQTNEKMSSIQMCECAF